MSSAFGLVRPLTSSALVGAATGSRSMTGLAGLTLAAPPGADNQPDRTLGRPWAKVMAALAAATEIGLDQLPSAPSRLAPPGLGSRLAAAAASGVIVARRAPGDGGAAGDGSRDVAAVANGTKAEPASPVVLVAACAVTAAVTAVATAWLGVQWRAWASDRFGRDWVGACLEDAAAISMAATAAALAS